MVELISCAIGLFVAFGLPSLLGRKNNRKFGDGNNRYDFKDYVNKKADEYENRE